MWEYIFGKEKDDKSKSIQATYDEDVGVNHFFEMHLNKQTFLSGEKRNGNAKNMKNMKWQYSESKSKHSFFHCKTEGENQRTNWGRENAEYIFL